MLLLNGYIAIAVRYSKISPANSRTFTNIPVHSRTKMRTFFGVSACILFASLLLILNNALENCMTACFNKTFLFIKGVLIYSNFLTEKKTQASG
jgi:hypothetical protein